MNSHIRIFGTHACYDCSPWLPDATMWDFDWIVAYWAFNGTMNVEWAQL